MRLPGWMVVTACTVLAASATEEIRTIAEIRSLSPERIRESPPCEVTARVTFIAEWKNRTEVAVQDETAGIYTYMQVDEAAGLALGG